MSNTALTTQVNTQSVALGDMQVMASAIVKSGLFGMKTPDQALALMIVATAEGRHPGSVASDYHIIQGRASLKADSMLARFQQSGGRVEWHDHTNEKVSATFTHPAGGSLRIDWDMARAIADGKVDANFETFLAESVGLNQQTLADTVRDRAKTDIITDGGQMLMDFSIGSRTSAVSTDTPSIRASNATLTGPANYSIGAFHGTPHKVYRFSLEKIGSGEGAQAYGWGLYFAENRGVGEQYRNVLAQKDTAERFVKDKRIQAAVQKLDSARLSSDAAAIKTASRELDLLSFDLEDELTNPGNLYTVELDVEPEDLLDWDKPLSEQSEKVQKAVQPLIQQAKKSFPRAGENVEGRWIYSYYADHRGGNSKAASEALLAAGIPGIRYLDQGSRSEGQGTYNYVIFDESKIKITGENGQPVAMQDAQAGAVSTDTSATSIGKKQDADYLAAVERGDMETAQRMVDEAAMTAGYSGSDHRMQHSAPDRESTALASIKTSGLLPNDYWQKPQFYQSMPEEWESFSVVRDALDRSEKYTSEGKDGAKVAKITVYRSVPKSVKEESIRNGDWVTPSKQYAAMEGRSIPEGYKIISQKVSLKNLWWDGNSIAELGFDDGKDYTYKNTKNNRKLIDPVTYDENGNVIPLSQRFNPRSADINYSIGFAPNGKPSNLTPDEQALTQSPEFKNWSGNLEVSEINKKVVSVVDVDDKVLTGKTIKDLRKNALQKTKSWWGTRELNDDLEADVLINRDTIEHMLSNFGAVQIHASLFVPQIVRSARKISDEPHNPEIPEIVRVHRLLAAIRFRGDIFPVEVVVKEHRGPKQHHAYDIEAITVKTETAEQVLPGGTDKELRSGSAAVSEINVQDLRSVVNSSVSVKTDGNGEPLASEIARFRQETGTSNFSISSQSEIDRVNRALGGMNRGPDERLKVYERAKAKFSSVLQENKDIIDAIRTNVTTDTAPALQQVEMDRASRLADIDAEENSEVGKALQDNADTFMPRIEAAQSSAERKRVERDAKERAKILEQGIRDKYAERKKLTEFQAKAQRDQIVQTAQARDSAANARMRDKVRLTKMTTALGSLDAILSVLPHEIQGKVGGFTVLTKIGTGDKALADFFIKRIEMIDRELERSLKKEYGNALDSLLERTKPKKAAAGEKPKGIGADIQSMFAVVRDSRNWTPEQVDGHIANIETQIASGNLTAEQEAMLTREADLVSLVGDWKNADSNRRAAALSAATETWAKGMSTFVQKKIREREERDMARAEAISATGKKGKYPERRERDKKDNGIEGQAHGWYIDTLSWDQVVNVLFGHESPLAIRLSDGQRKAEYAKIDGIQAKEDALHDFFTKLAGGKRVDGERLMWDMSQPSIPANGLNLSELEALTATMMWAQEDGRRHMTGELDETGNPIGDWHYDQKFVDDIEAQLSPEAKMVREFLWDNYGTEWFAINEVFREMNGINLPRIPKYSPVSVTPINIPSGMVADPVTGNAVSATSISPGALRNRGVAIAEPVFRNAIQTYIAHTRQMEHWKAFAPWIKEANGILRFRKVHNAMHEASGGESSLVIGKFLDVFAQGGNRDASLTLEISKTMGGMASRAAQVALVGRVGTLAIQTTQIGAASAELPVGAYLSRLGKLVTGNLGWGDALNSKYIQRRLKQMPPTVQIAMEGLKAGKPNQLKHQVQRIGQLISGTDALWTAGTYAMVYDYQLGQAKAAGYRGQPAEEYAHNIAERITDRLAQPTRMGTRSIYELTATNPGARLAWAFASESRKNLALLAYTKANRPLKRFLAATAGYVFFNLAMGALIRNAWKDMRDDGDDEDDFFDEKTWNWKRMGVAMLTEPLQGMPLLGDYTEKGINAALGQYHQSSDLINFERGIKSFKNIPDILQGERDAEGVLKDIDGMVSLMGLFNQNAAAAASLTHIASDFFGVVDNATTEE